MSATPMPSTASEIELAIRVDGIVGSVGDPQIGGREFDLLPGLRRRPEDGPCSYRLRAFSR